LRWACWGWPAWRWQAFTQVAHVALTAHGAGKSTGIKSVVHSSDPTAPGQKPKSAKTLTITFPAATKFNFKTHLVNTCKLTDKQLTAAFGRSCPRKTQIGTRSSGQTSAPTRLRWARTMREMDSSPA
jgi:hypothetical protein